MVVVDTVSQAAPQQVAALLERTNRALLGIVRDNFNTQYASNAASLAGFRDAVSAHGGTETEATLLADFRSHVPLSNYDAYKPFIDKFNARPCKEEDVENLLSPGLPDFFAVSSATSGTTPKILPKYDHNARLKTPHRQIFDPNSTPFAALMCTRYGDVKEIERAPGQVVQRIPVCITTGGILRRVLRRYIDDESQMTLPCSFISLPSTTHTHVFAHSSVRLRCTMGSDRDRISSLLSDHSRPLLPRTSRPGAFRCTVCDVDPRSRPLH